LPMTQPDGQPLKLLPQVLLDRRATNHFKGDPETRGASSVRV
jgi:hypothetical protein